MVNSFISAEDLESEMTVVRNEWESGENRPMGVLRKRVMSAAFDWHNYGNSTIGARSDLENVPIERLQAFYRKYYQPDNAVLVVAGRFDVDRALELVAEKFGAIPRPDRGGANTLFETYTAEPAQDGERTVTLERVGDTQYVMAVYHVPPGAHEQYAAVDVLAHILGVEPAGRLYRNLVEPGLAASVGASSFQLNEPGVLWAAVEVREEDSLETAADALFSTFEELAAAPPTEEEIERAKREYLSRIELAFNNPQRIALDLSEWASMGDWRLFFLHRDRLEQVTAEGVHEVAQTYLRNSNRTVGYFRPTDETPERAEIPEPPDVAALVADYSGREAVAEGEAFDPTPANIDRRTRVFELSNGVRVALLPKQTRGESVSVEFGFRHGTEEALMGRATAGDLAGSMLMRGTKKRSRQEISDELDRLKAQGRIGGGALQASGSFTTVRENLVPVLSLAAEVLREPAFDPKEFDLLREERLAAIESQRSEPMAQVPMAMSRHFGRWPADHPRYSPTFDEQIERLEAATVEEASEFWSSFYGGEGGTIAIVGDFDPDEIAAALEELFGDWRATEPYTRIADPHREVEAVSVDLETPDKTNAMMLAATNFSMRDDDEDYPALAMANYMLGGGFLSSRLATRIRQEEGLSYGVGSQVAAPPIDDSAVFVTYAIFAPENADEGSCRLPRRTPKGPGGRLHGGGVRDRAARLAGRPAESAVAGRGGRLDAQRQPVRRQDDGVHCGPGAGGRRADAGRGQRGAAQVRRGRRHLDLPRRGFREQAEPVTLRRRCAGRKAGAPRGRLQCGDERLDRLRVLQCPDVDGVLHGLAGEDSLDRRLELLAGERRRDLGNRPDLVSRRTPRPSRRALRGWPARAPAVRKRISKWSAIEPRNASRSSTDQRHRSS